MNNINYTGSFNEWDGRIRRLPLKTKWVGWRDTPTPEQETKKKESLLSWLEEREELINHLLLLLTGKDYGKKMENPFGRNKELRKILVACKCGCSTLINKFDVNLKERKFARGHNIINNNPNADGHTNLGKKFAEAHKENLSKAHLGIKPSISNKKKRSISQKLTLALKRAARTSLEISTSPVPCENI